MINRIRQLKALKIATSWLLLLSLVGAPSSAAAFSDLCPAQFDISTDCQDCGDSTLSSDQSDAGLDADHGGHGDAFGKGESNGHGAGHEQDCHANALCAPDLAPDVLGVLVEFQMPAVVAAPAPESSEWIVCAKLHANSSLVPGHSSINALYCRYLI